MLGTYGSSAFQCSDQFHSARDYLLYLFSNTQGFHTRNTISGERFTEHFYQLDKLITQPYVGVSDCYCSLNSCMSPRRKDKVGSGRTVNNIKHLNALFVDIDCYKEGLSPEQVLYTLQEDYYDRIIPAPTFAVHSGRGLYLIWRIDEDREALPRWQRVEAYLVNALREFGADDKAMDAARILRVPYTVNSKSGAMVSIMEFSDITYTLREVAEEYGVQCADCGGATHKQKQTAKMLATHFQIALPDFDNYQDTHDFIAKYLPQYKNTQDTIKRSKSARIYNLDALKSVDALAAGRIRDLHTLFSVIRKGVDCCREVALFLVRAITLDAAQDADAAINAALALNAEMDCPFSEQYVRTTTASAEKKWRETGKSYRYSTAKIIAALGITDAEQAQMDYLRSNPSTDTVSRKRRNNRLAYLAQLAAQGKSTKADAIADRRARVQQMMQNGASADEICASLSISARTFARDKSAILSEAPATVTCTKVQEIKNAVQTVKAFLAAILSKSIRKCRNYVRAEHVSVALPKIQPLYYNIPLRVAVLRARWRSLASILHLLC